MTKSVKDAKTGKKKATPVPREKRQVSDVMHEPIIDKETYDKAKAILEQKR